MKTTRRRVANPILTWESAGPDQEYRVIVRNQDTGERRAIYDGFRTECRLPPDLRLTPNQLAFRVMARPIGESEERFVRIREYAPIARLGDDYSTPAADLLTAEPTPGAGPYRLLVRNPSTGKPLIDLTRDEPRFLLPVGQLRDGSFHCDLKARVRGRWQTTLRLEVTDEMIAAAHARSERLVPVPPQERPEVRGASADHAPGRPERLAEETLNVGPRLLIVADVTALPDAAPIADPADVVRRQWWAGDGSGAVESVALTLEAHGLRGQFQLDVLAAEALGDEALASVAHTLTSRGHGLGLMINPEPWRGLSAELTEMRPGAVLKHALDRFTAVTGHAPQAVSFGQNMLGPSPLRQARALGVRAVFADRTEQHRLATWMRWRTTAFAAFDNLVVIPSAMARTGGQRLIVARIDPLALLLRRMVQSADQAEAWNLALAESLPNWIEAGWDRNPQGFAVLDDRDEIKTEMMTGLIAALARSGVASADLATVFSPSALRAWSEETEAFEPMIEQRRGPRALRRSGVRRYDAAYRQALGAPPA